VAECSEAKAEEIIEKMIVPLVAYDFQIDNESSVYSDEMPEFAMIRELLGDTITCIRKGLWLHHHGRTFPLTSAMYTEDDFVDAIAWIKHKHNVFDPDQGWTFVAVCDILGLDPDLTRRAAFEVDYDGPEPRRDRLW